jgi:hypothetical protein
MIKRLINEIDNFDIWMSKELQGARDNIKFTDFNTEKEYGKAMGKEIAFCNIANKLKDVTSLLHKIETECVRCKYDVICNDKDKCCFEEKGRDEG